MTPENLSAHFREELAASMARQRELASDAAARQRDAAAYDMRMLGGFMTAQLFRSDDPEGFAGLNAGVRVPTTVNHPGNASPA